MENHREAERRAAAFLARRDRGPWAAVDQLELDAWLSQSTAHRVAYLRLEATWEEARRLKALAAGLPANRVPEPGEWRQTPFFEHSARIHPPEGPSRGQRADAGLLPPTVSGGSLARQRRPLAVCAAVVAVLTCGAVYYLSAPPGTGYRTEVGAVRTVPLKDGSTITLNTASEVHVDLKPDQRDIRLDRGEAFFTVAKDSHRPFIVEAGNKRVVAVGTAFSVRRLGGDIRVAVTEGRVRVETVSKSNGPIPRRSPPLDSTVQSGAGEVFVASGGVASVGDGGAVVAEEPLSRVEEGLSWRQGYLTFHDESLADAVAEFNRYNVQQIVITDPAVAAVRISGTFRAVNRQAFVRVLDEGFGIHSNLEGEVTTLSRR